MVVTTLVVQTGQDSLRRYYNSKRLSEHLYPLKAGHPRSYRVLRIAYCVLRIAYCVLRIATPPWSVTCLDSYIATF